MQRFIIIILLSSGFLIARAQVGLTPRCPYKDIQTTDSRIIKEAEDFTITTTDGVVRNLYNTLDSGKTVFIDLFYTTCTYCQLYALVIEEAYLETGAGEGDIEFWGISNNLFDTNWVIDQYRENYGVSNPCAGPWGGGLTAFSIIVEGQEFYGFPTYCVICPDRNMLFGICYPPVAPCLYAYFEDCTVGLDDNTNITDQKSTVNIYPNPSAEGFFIDFISDKDEQINIELYNLQGVPVLSSSFDPEEGIQTKYISTKHLQNGVYYLKIYQDGKLVDTQKALIFR